MDGKSWGDEMEDPTDKIEAAKEAEQEALAGALVVGDLKGSKLSAIAKEYTPPVSPGKTESKKIESVGGADELKEAVGSDEYVHPETTGLVSKDGWDSFHLPEACVKGVEEVMKWSYPSKIQAETLPHALAG